VKSFKKTNMRHTWRERERERERKKRRRRKRRKKKQILDFQLCLLLLPFRRRREIAQVKEDEGSEGKVTETEEMEGGRAKGERLVEKKSRKNG
jgi:hypothetical protein